MQLHPNAQNAKPEADNLARGLHAVASYILVITFGLVPILFLPFITLSIGYGKVFVVVCAIFLALIFYSLSVLRAGTVSVRAPLPLIALWAIAGVALFSAFVSGDRSDALMGDVFSVHTALFIALLALITTTIGILSGAKAHIMRLYMLLTASTVVLGLFHLTRLIFGPSTISLGLFTDATTSPVGSWNDLALFLGLSVILSIVALEQLPLPRLGQFLFSGVVVVALLLLAVINFSAVWFVLGLTSLVLLVYTLSKDRLGSAAAAKNSREPASLVSVIVIGMVFIVSAGFIAVSFLNQVNQLSQQEPVGIDLAEKFGISYFEVRPRVSTTFDIARHVYSDQPIVGIGPNRFADAWRMHKDRSINDTIFWNTDFAAGNGYVTTLFVTTGLLGAVTWVLFFGLFAFFGLRMLLRGVVVDRFWYFIGSASFVAALYLWTMAVVYVPGPAILILAAVCTGLTLLAGRVLLPSNGLALQVATNRRSGFVLIAAVTLLIVGSVGVLYELGRHSVALATYNHTLQSISSDTSLEEIETQIRGAFALSQNDRFINQIARFQLSRMNALLATEEPTAEQQQTFQQAARDGLQAAERAVTIDGTEPVNWATLGSIYSVLTAAGMSDVGERAAEAFAKARELAPKNPEYVLLEAQLRLRQNNQEEARQLAERSLELKPNYAPALMFLTELDVAAGNTEAAIERVQSMLAIDAQNAAHYYRLGLLLMSEERAAEAIAAFQRAVEIDTNYANARYFLARAYLAEGERDAALEQLYTVRESNPDNEQLSELIRQVEAGESGDALLETGDIAEPEPQSENGDVTTSEQVPDNDLLAPVNAGGGGNAGTSTEAVSTSTDNQE